jgi:Mrp family chromosome partitioning ATPase/uncharacterized protein involved in exopolysaccharide biosynthesis
MRDKPNDAPQFGTPADKQQEIAPDQVLPDIEETPEEKIVPASETIPQTEEKASGEISDNPADPAPARFGDEPSLRIKDQFSGLNTIPQTLTRDASRPSKASIPGAGLAETARPGRSIRREASFQDFFRNLDIIKIVRGIYRKFWIVLLSAFGMLLLFLPIARALKGGVTWSAESVIIYTKPTQKQIDVQGSSFLLRPLTQDTLVDMFLSPTHIRALEEATGFKPLTKNVSFDSQSKSDIVTLKVSAMPSEKAAIDGVNKLSDIIISNNDQYYRQLAATAYEQYKAQRETTEQAFNEAVKAVEEFQLKNQLLELNTQYQNYFASVNAASERLSIAQVAHEGLLVRIKNYEKMIAELPEEVLNEAQENNPLKGRISNAEAALLQARIQYAADNPKILRQERELEELRKLLQSGTFDETRERTYLKNPLKGQLEGDLLKLRSEEDVAAQQVVSLRKDFATLQARFQDLPRLEKEYAALLGKRAQTDAALKVLKSSEESSRLTMQANLSDFKLISAAATAEPTAASLIGKIIPIFGFIFGFFGGLIVVLIIELLDAKIRTQQQLETAYDAPCLASIIEIPHLETYDTYQLLLPSLREISERLNVVLQGHRAKVFGFFSSLDGEGKSTLSFNLARYYSSLHIKVLFVGFDALSNPCLPDAGDTGWPQRGIEDYLRGQAELTDMITSINGVDVIRVQTLQSDLLDLAKGSAMPRLWDLLRQNYDIVITEAPAVLDHPISGTLAGFLDEIIYVLASSVSDRRLVDAGLEFLEDRGLAPRALIFNRVNPYYLEDVRQQRIIRNLAEPRSPVDDLLAFFHRFAKPANDQSIQSAMSTSLPAADEDVSLQDEEALPDFIGEEEIELSDEEFQQEETPLPELIGEDTIEPASSEGDDPVDTEIPEHIEKENADIKNEMADEASEAEKEPEEISFKKWFGDPNARQAKKPGKESEDDEK